MNGELVVRRLRDLIPVPDVGDQHPERELSEVLNEMVQILCREAWGLVLCHVHLCLPSSCCASSCAREHMQRLGQHNRYEGVTDQGFPANTG